MSKEPNGKNRSTGLTIWMIGYLFTLGFGGLESLSNLGVWEQIKVVILSAIMWPMILGDMIKGVL